MCTRDAPDSNQSMSLWMSFLKRSPDPPLYWRLGFWLRRAYVRRKKA